MHNIYSGIGDRLMPPFVVGEIYRRRDLHAQYGGQAQGGISTPREHPFIMLISGESGELYGYRDGSQPDGTFWYTGEGQVGDMQMVRGNRAIHNHQQDGKALYLFEDLNNGRLRHIGEAVFLGWHEALAPDRNRAERRVIVFELALDTSAAGPAVPDVGEPRVSTAEDRGLWARPLEDLRQQALSVTPAEGPPAMRRANVYSRSRAVRTYVLRRANGTCEGCGALAPFMTADGRPYLEPHHIRRRADGGPDHPRWVAAVCPNCHRRAHYAQDAREFGRHLAHVVGGREPD